MADQIPTIKARGHKNARCDLTAEYVESVLDYDPETGEFRWKVSRPPRGRIGAIAGHIKRNGHRYIGLNGGTEYLASRLAWLIMKDEWPEHEIDHEDRDPGNDRWNNLRPATSTQNIANRVTRNATGYKGVQWRPKLGKFTAKIMINRKQIYLGLFHTAAEAHAAYCAAASAEHGEFFHSEALTRPRGRRDS
jgi:AP2 domain/HNH endonuclease